MGASGAPTTVGRHGGLVPPAPFFILLSMMRFFRSLVGAALVACAVCLPAEAASVSIRSCYDGDTCRSTTGERIRLACIDTPEVGQAGASAATNATRSLVQGKTVGIRRITRDRYGRTIAELYAPNGVNVGEQLVAQGNARIYRRYAYQCPWAR